MKKWMKGKFINDWSPHPLTSEEITPEGLDRAALEPCVGGAFFPGLEAGWMMRDIGPDSIALFTEELAAARTVVWNGPVGVSEIPDFSGRNKGELRHRRGPLCSHGSGR